MPVDPNQPSGPKYPLPPDPWFGGGIPGLALNPRRGSTGGVDLRWWRQQNIALCGRPQGCPPPTPGIGGGVRVDLPTLKDYRDAFGRDGPVGSPVDAFVGPYIPPTAPAPARVVRPSVVPSWIGTFVGTIARRLPLFALFWPGQLGDDDEVSREELLRRFPGVEPPLSKGPPRRPRAAPPDDLPDWLNPANYPIPRVIRIPLRGPYPLPGTRTRPLLQPWMDPGLQPTPTMRPGTAPQPVSRPATTTRPAPTRAPSPVRAPFRFPFEFPVPLPFSLPLSVPRPDLFPGTPTAPGRPGVRPSLPRPGLTPRNPPGVEFTRSPSRDPFPDPLQQPGRADPCNCPKTKTKQKKKRDRCTNPVVGKTRTTKNGNQYIHTKRLVKCR